MRDSYWYNTKIDNLSESWVVAMNQSDFARALVKHPNVFEMYFNTVKPIDRSSFSTLIETNEDFRSYLVKWLSSNSTLRFELIHVFISTMGVLIKFIDHTEVLFAELMYLESSSDDLLCDVDSYQFTPRFLQPVLGEIGERTSETVKRINQLKKKILECPLPLCFYLDNVITRLAEMHMAGKINLPSFVLDVCDGVIVEQQERNALYEFGLEHLLDILPPQPVLYMLINPFHINHPKMEILEVLVWLQDYVSEVIQGQGIKVRLRLCSLADGIHKTRFAAENFDGFDQKEIEKMACDLATEGFNQLKSNPVKVGVTIQQHLEFQASTAYVLSNCSTTN